MGYTITSNDVKSINKKLEKQGIRDWRLREAHTIPKGTTVYRTTSNLSENDEGTTYISYMDADRIHYKGGWIRNQSKNGKAYENTYTLKEDLNVPSRKEAMDVVDKIMKENKDLVNKTVEAWADAAMPTKSFAWQEWMWNHDDSGIADEKKLRKQFVDEKLKDFGSYTSEEAAFFAMQSFGLNPQLRSKVIEELSSRGYNAMTDEASVGGQGHYLKEGVDPLIIFERSGKLYKQSTSEIMPNEDYKYEREYNKKMARSHYWDKRNDKW